MEIDGDNAEARAWLRVAQRWLVNVEGAMLTLGETTHTYREDCPLLAVARRNWECYSELATMLEQIIADAEAKLTREEGHGD